MRVIYMGKNKPAVIAGLEHLIERKVEVAAVVAPSENVLPLGNARRLRDIASAHGLPLLSDTEIYARLKDPNGPGAELTNIDLAISFLFWKRIRKPLIGLPRLGCINFHPAPLPDIRGVGGYNIAVYEQHPEWGVSAHFVDESFDTGDLVQVDRFSIQPDEETAFSLEQKSMVALLDLFREVMDAAIDTGTLPRQPQGKGRYIDTAEFEALRQVQPTDTPEQIERKIRAFWYPPYPGAQTSVNGANFTLVSERLLQQIAQHYHSHGE